MASTYCCVSSHEKYSLAFDFNVVSPYFQREASVLIFNLFSSLLDLTNSECPVVLASLLDVARKSLGNGGNDQETRTNNATHAELFGGLAAPC